MKLFIYGVLNLIKNQITETCDVIEAQMRIGIASVLYSKYPDVFNNVAFTPDKCREIDEYYKTYIGIVDDDWSKKFACENTDGLFWVIKLALEKVY